MLIAQLTGASNNTAILLGLSDVNLLRLTQGQMISISAKSHPHAASFLKDLEILIIYGKSELDMVDFLRANGLVTKDTKQHIDPRLR